MITADTSVVVPALLDWHDHHKIARPAIAGVDRLAGHVLAEAFSVLTRLPHGLALDPIDAADLLLEAFPGPPFVLNAESHVSMLRSLALGGIRGGTVYDGVVAATALLADAELISLDARAVATYRAVGVRFRRPD